MNKDTYRWKITFKHPDTGKPMSVLREAKSRAAACFDAIASLSEAHIEALETVPMPEKAKGTRLEMLYQDIIEVYAEPDEAGCPQTPKKTQLLKQDILTKKRETKV